MAKTDLLVAGGGPAGLAAAYEATGHGAGVRVVERLPLIGGLARTIEFDGCRFDIGPHRFFTRNAEIRALFEQIVADDMIRVPRLTRILHDGRFFNYPLTPVNALGGTGLAEATALGASYAGARLAAAIGRPVGASFEDWVVRSFGRRLYERFFKTYTEKVWGISCRAISADWAGQRIRGLSLSSALREALAGGRGGAVKSLIREFGYPRLGAGQTYDKMAAATRHRGGQLTTATTLVGLRAEGRTVRAATVDDGSGAVDIEARAFLLSAPLTDVVGMLQPAVPAEVVAAARALRYRDHLSVNLVVAGRPFPDNWIYVHDARVRAARVASYRNFSEAMAGGRDVSPLTVEYFSFAGDDIDRRSDDELIELATSELARLDLVARDRIEAGFVVRSRRAYPVLEIGHERHVAVIRAWLSGFDNLLPIGRTGMFKYNNQDHAMMTGLLAARTALGLGRFDPWAVNIDAEYHEAAPQR